MQRPEELKTVARGLLLAAGLVCAIGMIAPAFQGAEKAFVPWDKAAHFIAFYGLTLLMFAAFPARRRLDLVAIAAFAGAAIEIIQMLDGRDAELGDMLADTCGALAVYAPVYLDRIGKLQVERRKPAKVEASAPEPEPQLV